MSKAVIMGIADGMQAILAGRTKIEVNRKSREWSGIAKLLVMYGYIPANCKDDIVLFVKLHGRM